MKKCPTPPKLFLCKKCNVFFFTFSKLKKPTHSKCASHNTRLATQQELDEINKINGTHFVHNIEELLNEPTETDIRGH